MRWGVPKQKRHCAAYGGISHQVTIVQKHKDFVIDVGLRTAVPIMSPANPSRRDS
jgi:hypothetical protein